ALCADVHVQSLHVEDDVLLIHDHALSSGVSSWCRPSPARLMAKISSASAVPGIAISQKEKNMYALASEIIRPQEGSGGCTPSPRKDSAASSRMALAASSVAITIRWGTTLGSTSPRTMRQVEAPAACAADTYSSDRTCWVALRMTTA